MRELEPLFHAESTVNLLQAAVGSAVWSRLNFGLAVLGGQTGRTQNPEENQIAAFGRPECFYHLPAVTYPQKIGVDGRQSGRTSAGDIGVLVPRGRCSRSSWLQRALRFILQPILATATILHARRPEATSKIQRDGMSVTGPSNCAAARISQVCPTTGRSQ